ncbi:MAG: M15 family peptidase [Deltaproteobacteria bacterium]|nr:MAG: M15 family peptidase [Deltaproteobacteria bacterium]
MIALTEKEMPSRKIEDCVPELQEKYWLFKEKMAEAGVPFMLTCTYRSQEEQNNLYAQGRTKPGQVVTWTKRSRHIDRKAFDIAILTPLSPPLDKGGKEGGLSPTWDVKVNVNANDIPDYIEAGQIGERVGLTWGGRFRNSKGQPRPDYPHFKV